MNKKEIYIAKIKAELDKLNLTMDELGSKAHDARIEARQQYEEEMSKLRHQSKLALAKLDDLKQASEDTWESMVAEVDKMRDAFTHSFHYFQSQVKK
jgi:ribosome recycling factor